ncbi:hypothetical protein G6L52_32690 [Agrobacterium rhizogenes]|nr:hypothetical protein [Rhizobium rhizogenes]
MLRLAGSGTSSREIAVVLGIARSTVQDNLQRAAAIGLSWPLPGELTDDALENKLFARNGIKQGTRRRVDAILDRLVHNAYRIDLTGESMRKQRSPIAPETPHA